MQVVSLILASFASAGSYCPPAGDVQARVDYCFENKLFVDAADQCLSKFDGDVAAQSAALAGSFVDAAARSVSAQESKLSNTGKDFSGTEASLGALLDNAARARAELVAYSRTLIYVNDSSPSFLDYFGLLGSHQQDPCFHDNYLSLLDRIAKLDKRIADLRRTNGRVLAMAGVNGARRAGLDAGLAGAALREGVGQGAAVPKGVSRAPASTITGSVQDPKLPR